MEKHNLPHIRLFEQISEEQLPQMLGCIGAREQCYGKGTFLALEGEELKQIGLVLDGIVHMVKEDVWGNKLLLGTFAAGEVFGESFVCNDLSEATVSFLAATPCRVLLMPFGRLLRTCENACQFHQQLIENMVFLMAGKQVQMMRKMEILSQKTIREKVLTWLSQQVQAHGNRHFAAPMGRVALAEYLGIDRSALSRELSNMRAEGLISYDKTTYTLPK